MLERFTERARRVIFFARYEASRFGSPYIESEHLLLGIVREDKALANRFLRSEVASVREQVEMKPFSQTGKRPTRTSPFSNKQRPSTRRPGSQLTLTPPGDFTNNKANQHVGMNAILSPTVRRDHRGECGARHGIPAVFLENHRSQIPQVQPSVSG
jgi:ATP-dependent Clp protease ATP-binding subunit ClpA